MFVKAAVAGCFTRITATAALSQDNPMVGSAPMLAGRTIVENAVNSAGHTVLVAAVQAAGPSPSWPR